VRPLKRGCGQCGSLTPVGKEEGRRRRIRRGAAGCAGRGGARGTEPARSRAVRKGGRSPGREHGGAHLGT
jgi:hypothetical protein